MSPDIGDFDGLCLKKTREAGSVESSTKDGCFVCVYIRSDFVSKTSFVRM
jgi:hypothetical protein